MTILDEKIGSVIIKLSKASSEVIQSYEYYRELIDLHELTSKLAKGSKVSYFPNNRMDIAPTNATQARHMVDTLIERAILEGGCVTEEMVIHLELAKESIESIRNSNLTLDKLSTRLDTAGTLTISLSTMLQERIGYLTTRNVPDEHPVAKEILSFAGKVHLAAVDLGRVIAESSIA